MELWAVRLDRALTERETEELLRLLPSQRRARLTGRTEEPLCAYALLTLLLRRRWGWQTLSEPELTERGKPFFPDAPEVCFNISHTGGAALAAVSDRPVGVDVERIRPVRAAALRRVAGTESETEFFRLWVRREARTKLRGDGIAAMLRSEPPLLPQEHYRELSLFPGYAAGAAVFGAPPELRMRIWSLDELLTALRQTENAPA